MKVTTFRHLAAGASAAALVSASAFFGASTAFAQPKHPQTPTTVTGTDTGEPPAATAKPEAKPVKTSITAEEFRKSGLKVKFTGLQDRDVAIVRDAGGFATDSTVTSSGDAVEVVLFANTDKSVEELEEAGKLELTFTVERGIEPGTPPIPAGSATIEITKDDGSDEAPAFDPKVTAAPDEITAADLADKNKGITITASNLKAGDVVANTLIDETETAEGDTAETKVYYDGDASDFTVGQKVDFTVSVTRGEESKSFDFTVTIVGEDTGDDETAEPELKISPEKISVTDFRNEKKGVKLAVSNCTPDETATFVIEHENGELKREVDAKADNKGTAVIKHIHGVGDGKDSAYLGKYTVTATCGDGEATGSFSVHADDDGKGGGDSDKADRDRKGELPRTGTELTALYGAAGLLAVGGAAMMISRRKTAKK